MTRCVIALALAIQLIESWRRFKGWAGIAERPERTGAPLGVVAANIVERLRHPVVRHAVAAIIVFEAAAVGAWASGHRNHVENALSAAIFSVTGIASALCDGKLP